MKFLFFNMCWFIGCVVSCFKSFLTKVNFVITSNCCRNLKLIFRFVLKLNFRELFIKQIVNTNISHKPTF